MGNIKIKRATNKRLDGKNIRWEPVDEGFIWRSVDVFVRLREYYSSPGFQKSLTECVKGLLP